MFSQFATVALLLAGAGFFLAGTLGLLRFPDVYTRIHALTKADNVGLGMIAAGLALQADAWTDVIKIGTVWLLVLLASAAGAHLVARGALNKGIPLWKP